MAVPKPLILAAFLCVVAAGETLDQLLNNVFTSPSPDHSYTQGRPCDNEPKSACKCVAHHLCKSNSGSEDPQSVNTDGLGLIDIRVKEDECSDYLEVCCNEPIEDSARVTPRPPTTRQGCGKRNPYGVGFRITGDADGESQFGEFPWMSAILREETTDGKTINVFQCGGSLIHPQVVLTAAHCVRNFENYIVRVGEWDTQTENELLAHQDLYVSNLVIHPDYKPGVLHNDVALLFLGDAITFADNVDVVCLPEQDQDFDYSRCFTSGWGKDTFGQEGKYQVILKKVEVPIVPFETCESSLRMTRLGPQFILDPSFICAGGEVGKDACKGDGGSPLVCPIGDSEIYAQAGIVAWGIGCGGTVPGIYANVAKFRDWIDQELSQKSLDQSFYRVGVNDLNSRLGNSTSQQKN